MEVIQPPKAINFDSDNLSTEWKKWENHLKFYLTATEKDEKSDAIKTSILMACIGEKGREIYETFQFPAKANATDPEPSMVFTEVVKKFKEYCNPRKNVTILRYKFFTYKQLEGQSFDDFVTKLKVLAQECELETLKDSLIKDVVVIGVLDDKLRERLMREPNLNLVKAVQLGQAAAETKKHAAELKNNKLETDHSVDRVERERECANKNMVTNCKFCMSNHPRGKCFAYGKECLKCHRMNHYARCCPAKKNYNDANNNGAQRYISARNQESGRRNQHVDSVGNDPFVIETIELKKSNVVNSEVDTIASMKTKVISQVDVADDNDHVHDVDTTPSTDWIVNVNTNESNVQFKIDTGAQCNVLPKHIYNKLNKRPKLLPNDASLSAYSETELKVCGRCVLTLIHKEKVHKVLFYVVETNRAPLLGLKTCSRLNLIRRVDDVSSGDGIRSRVLKEYADVFGEMGTLKRTYHMVMKDDAVPVVAPPRRVPYGLDERVYEELDRMERLGVVEKIPENEPTEWQNTLVVVEKPNGKVRLCLDPRHLNKAVKREYFQLPTTESIMAKMHGAKYFSKLDASSGYWQIKVDEETSKRLAFMTPKGRYRFTRLPFGIHSASEVFQSEVAQIIAGMDGVDNSQDDIVIWGKSEKEQEDRLFRVLDRIRKSGMKLNLSKCVFGQKEITFLGHVISGEGIKPDPEKTRAINDMPIPKSKVELQRFLGNYLGKFLPNLSTVTTPLRELLQKNVVFAMEKPQVDAVNKLKEMVTSEAVLKFYDTNLPTRVRSDASTEGLGAMLEQKHGEMWHPIAYASRSLNPSEKNYAAIEAETLSVVFACEKFREYLYGKPFVVQNDHKPLQSIFSKPITSCPLRIQRFFLRLQRYEFTLEYNSGTTMKVSDALSRAAVKNSEPEISDFDMKFYVHAVINSIPISEKKLTKLKNETEKDEVLSTLKSYIENGWPTEIDQRVAPYKSIRDELSSIDGMLLKGNRLIVPTSMRK